MMDRKPLYNPHHQFSQSVLYIYRIKPSSILNKRTLKLSTSLYNLIGLKVLRIEEELDLPVKKGKSSSLW